MATFYRNPDRCYSILDFKDGEKIEYYGECEKRSAQKECVLYKSEHEIRMIRRDEIKDGNPCQS